MLATKSNGQAKYIYFYMENFPYHGTYVYALYDACFFMRNYFLITQIVTFDNWHHQAQYKFTLKKGITVPKLSKQTSNNKLFDPWL